MRPCPLCGGEPELYPAEALTWVACRQCRLTLIGETEAEVLARWDHRAEMPPDSAAGREQAIARMMGHLETALAAARSLISGHQPEETRDGIGTTA